MRPRKFVRSTALVLVLTAALTVTAFAADPTQRPANETDNKSSYYPTSVEMTEDENLSFPHCPRRAIDSHENCGRRMKQSVCRFFYPIQQHIKQKKEN